MNDLIIRVIVAVFGVGIGIFIWQMWKKLFPLESDDITDLESWIREEGDEKENEKREH